MATYYVATTGNDTTGDGSIGSPWLTIAKGQSMLSAGDTLYVRGGRYYESVTITKQGTEGSPITISAYPSEIPILDGTEVVAGWTQCEEDDAFLTVQGVVNPNYANIYWAKIHEDVLPSSLNSFMLFENNIHSRIARWPDQEFGYGYDTSLFNSVAPEAYGETEFLLDSTRLTQADNYWAGAWIDIWSHAANNIIVRRTIGSSSQSAHTVTFTVPLTQPISYGTLPDAYSIVNHPHVLDSAGEFAFTTAVDEDGYYTFYLWPSSVDSLVSGITIPSKTNGFFSSFKSNIEINGFHIQGYTGHGLNIYHYPPSYIENISVKNCTVQDVGGSGLYLRQCNDAIVDALIVKRAEAFGVLLSGGSGGLIQNCDIEATNRTNLYGSGVTNCKIIDNICRGSSGVHGNGLAIYDSSLRVLVARNYCKDSNMAVQSSVDVVFYANVVEKAMNTWPNWAGYTKMTGYQVYINNTFLGGLTLFKPATSDIPNYPDPIPWPDNYVINNTIEGFGYWDAKDMVDLSYNLYTALSWYQNVRYGWSLQIGEIDGSSLDKSSIFNDPVSDVKDYFPAINSPVISKGKDISSILETIGIPIWFPDFDFTKDKAGNDWNDTPSMGAYEYLSGESGEEAPDSVDIYYTLNSSCNGNGSISNGTTSWSSSSQSHRDGVSVTLTALETSLSIFIGWSGDITSSEASITFNMDKDYTIVANFAEAERKSLSLKSITNDFLILTKKHRI